MTYYAIALGMLAIYFGLIFLLANKSDSRTTPPPRGGQEHTRMSFAEFHAARAERFAAQSERPMTTHAQKKRPA